MSLPFKQARLPSMSCMLWLARQRCGGGEAAWLADKFASMASEAIRVAKKIPVTPLEDAGAIGEDVEMVEASYGMIVSMDHATAWFMGPRVRLAMAIVDM